MLSGNAQFPTVSVPSECSSKQQMYCFVKNVCKYYAKYLKPFNTLLTKLNRNECCL